MLTGRFVFQYLGWGVAAAATPCIMAITGSAFFGMSLAAQFGMDFTLGPYSLAAAGVMAGAVTQVSLTCTCLTSMRQYPFLHDDESALSVCYTYHTCTFFCIVPHTANLTGGCVASWLHDTTIATS